MTSYNWRMRRVQGLLAPGVFAISFSAFAVALAAPSAPDPVITPLSPAEPMKRTRFAPGYHLELVAAEPLVKEPVAISWDGDGRLYVVELLGYMQDIHGHGQKDPVGRVSRLEDTDGDGKMDRRTTFLDKLVEPRAVLTVDDAVLVAEMPHLWLARDTDGDGKADEKKAIDDQYGSASMNVEVAPNSLVWGRDNWIHNTHSPFKYRFRAEGGGRLERAPSPMGGQWGLGQDDMGNFYYSNSVQPFQGDQIAKEYWARYNLLGSRGDWYDPRTRLGSFNEVWPAVRITDAHPGDSQLRPDGTLLLFTASGGQTVFRGDRLPGLAGNYFIPEPVGRLVRRAVIHAEDG